MADFRAGWVSTLGVKRLGGQEASLRVWVGAPRILYDVPEWEVQALVTRIGSRGEVYERLGQEP